MKVILPLATLVATIALQGVANASAVCDLKLTELPTQEQAHTKNTIETMIAGEVIGYITGKPSMLTTIYEELDNENVTYTNHLLAYKIAVTDTPDQTKNFENGLFSKESRLKHQKDSMDLTGDEASKGKPANQYMTCLLTEVVTGSSFAIELAKNYSDFVKPRATQEQIGYFETTAVKGEAKNTVGTGNKYSEPDQWEGSKFFIVDASFKNLDTESRLPAAGSLYITYNGKEYEFDTTEAIMAKGYNIWFNSINPLLTMKTKIVYRIPEEIYGDVYWMPGRNPKGVKLYAGNIPAPKSAQ